MKKAFILGVIIAALPALAHAADERARRDINGNPTLLAIDETTGEIRKVKVDADGNLLTVSSGTAVLAPDAATETKQDTGNTSLSSIDGKIPASPSTAGNQTTGNTSLATIAGDTTSMDAKTPSLGAAATAASVPVNIASDQTVPVSAASLPLPSGAATSANQTTGNTSLSTIAGDTTSIDGKTPSQGQAASAASVPVVIASDQSDISVDDGGNSLTVDAVQLDIDDLTFASDKVDASGSTLGANSGIDIGDVTINNASGASAVNVQDGGNSLSVDDGGTVLSVDDAGGSLTIDGTVTANAGTGIFDTTGSSISVANVEGTSLSVDDNGGTLSVDDGAGSLTVDAIQLDIDDLTFAADKVDASGSTLGSNSGVDIGDVTINNASGGSAVNVQDGGNVLSIDDAGGSLTVDATQLDVDDLTFAADKVDASGSTLGANSGVDIGDVTINNAGAGAAVNIQDGGNVISIDDAGSTISIDDGGGIITVDGTVIQDLSGNDTPTESFTNITTVATVLAASAIRESSLICNEGPEPVRCGSGSVTTTTGQRLLVDQCYTLDATKPYRGLYACVSTTGPSSKVTASASN